MNNDKQYVAELAKGELTRLWDQVDNLNNGYEPIGFLDYYTEKLTGLILQECISKAEDYGLGCDAVEQLKVYFGISK